MGILEDLRDGKPCRWTGVCGEMSAVGGCTCGEAADEIERLRELVNRLATALDFEANHLGNKILARDALKDGE